MTKPDQQGYLGHLEDKSTEDLIELLKRQEGLINKQKFIQRLPDKGEKIQHMIRRLRELIAQHETVDETTDQFEKMALGAETARRQRTAQWEDEEEAALLRPIINHGTTGKVFEASSHTGNLLGDGECETFVNVYDKVIKKVDASKVKPRYLPNRSIYASNVHELVEKIGSLEVLSEGKPLTRGKRCIKKTPERTKSSETVKAAHAHHEDLSSTCSTTEGTIDTSHSLEDPKDGSTINTKCGGKTSALRNRYDDVLESAMPKTKPKHVAAKMISLTDAMHLQRAQQRNHAKAQAQQAAERLAHSLQVGMSTFDPEGASADSHRYREIRDEVDSDDDLEAPD